MTKFADEIKFLTETRLLLQNLINKVVVIKYGGAAMKDTLITEQVIEDIVFLHTIGVKVILVHGGGPEINKWLNKVNIPAKFCNGIRITDSNTMEIVEMVLTGRVNKTLVKLINKQHACAVGISGQDAKLIIAEPLYNDYNNLVADIKVVNPLILINLLKHKYIPVISPIASDERGHSYNINADIVAGAVSCKLQANQLIILTDTPGILSQANNSLSRVSQLCLDEINNLIQNNIITGGMLPKVNTCINALLNGVSITSIIDGRVPHSILLHLLTSEPIGSIIVQ